MRLVRGLTISSDMQAVVTVLGQSCYYEVSGTYC